jgi:hypothetical protein
MKRWKQRDSNEDNWTEELKFQTGNANWRGIARDAPSVGRHSPPAEERDLMNRDALAGYNCERLC